MPYTIATTSNFTIEGNELNAAERAFLRDTKVYAVDGVEAGSAALRAFIRDHRIAAITGRVAGGTLINSTSHAAFVVEGKPRGNEILADASLFSLEGRCGPSSFEHFAKSAAFTIEILPQEAVP